uniref:C2H2-type domain-containing protein n=1 Tax=Caenorhabditis japonica TaxID=281687 RepID=A0A8R1HU88_CAEJA
MGPSSFPHLFFLLPDQNKMSNKGFHQCPICYKVYNFASTLNRHRRTHSVGNFTCTICQKTLSRTSDKHYHCREVHRIAKSQTCSCCNWTWRSSLDLTRHRTSMREMQQLGDVVPIVKNDLPPGSFAYHHPQPSCQTAYSVLSCTVAPPGDEHISIHTNHQLCQPVFNVKQFFLDWYTTAIKLGFQPPMGEKLTREHYDGDKYFGELDECQIDVEH